MNTLTKIIAGATLLASAACNKPAEEIVPQEIIPQSFSRSEFQPRSEFQKPTYSIEAVINGALVDAVIFAESGGDPNAERYEPDCNDTSYGLMQVLTGTARDLSRRHSDLPSLDLNKDGNTTYQEVKTSLLNPEINVLYGTASLNEELKRYGTLELTVAAHNSGFGPRSALIQSELNDIYSLNLVLDGGLGENSTKAIKRFQKDNGLDVDGRAGPLTRKMLDKVYSEMFPENNRPKGIIPQNGTTPEYVTKVMDQYRTNLQKTDLTMNKE